jgi:hypothetical protein
MRRFERLYVIVLTVLTLPVPVFGGESELRPYAEAVSDYSAQFIANAAHAQLQKEFRRYKAPDRAQWHKALKQLGWTDEDRGTLDTQLPEGGNEAVAHWVDEAIVLEADGNKIELGVAEYIRGTLRVNGAAFRWNPKRSVTENLVAYKALFNPSIEKTASLWDRLVPNARAESRSSTLEIQLAGFKIQTVMDASKGRLEMLKHFLKDEVESQIVACKGNTPDEVFSNLEGKAREVAKNVNLIRTGQSALFTSCGDVQKFATETFNRESPVAYSQTFGSVGVRRLCSKLSEWSNCLNTKLAASASASGHKGDLPNRHDWSDRSDQDPQAGKAR